MSFIKQNKIVLIGASIPVLVLLAIIASIHLPFLFVKPQYDFLYVKLDGMTESGYEVKFDRLGVGKLIEKTLSSGRDRPQLYFYDVSDDTTRMISFQEAQTLNLDSESVSPDGFEIVYGGTESKRDYSYRYIKKDGVRRKLDIVFETPHFYNFVFVGWVKK